jgi:hypothetical protein
MLDLNSSTQNLANMIRDVWIRERRRYEEQLTGKPSRYARGDYLPRYDGGEDGAGRTHKPFWPKAARYFVMYNLNPRRWVRYALGTFQAQGRRDTRRFATPHALVSEELRKKYTEYLKELPERFRAELDSQSSTAMLRFRQRARSKALDYTRDQALASVLLDLSLPLSALFRYSAAEAGGLPDVATRFFDPALMQYFFEQELYDTAWEGYIPDSMKQAASAAQKSFTA